MGRVVVILALCLGGVEAFFPGNLQCGRPLRRSAAMGLRRGRVAMSSAADETMTWQEALEKALAPMSSLAERQIMVQNLIARRTEVLDDLQSAAANGSPEELLPEDSEVRRAAMGVKAVQRQILEDVVPTIVAEAPNLPSALLSNGPEIVDEKSITNQLFKYRIAIMRLSCTRSPSSK